MHNHKIVTLTFVHFFSSMSRQC